MENKKQSGSVKPNIKKEIKKDKYSFSDKEKKKKSKDDLSKEVEAKKRLSSFYVDHKEEWLKRRMGKRIKTSKSKVKHKIMRFAKFKDLELVSVVHVTTDGRIFLVPAIKEDNQLYYHAEKEHYIDCDEAIEIKYHDGFVEDGYFCHSLLPETFRPSVNIDFDVALECKKLKYHREKLKEVTASSISLDLSNSQRKVVKYVALLAFMAGAGCGFFGAFFAIAGMM